MANTDSSATNESGPITASVERLRAELDRWMEAAISGGEKALNTIGIGPRGAWKPPLDLVESHDEVVVRMDVPGVDGDALEIALAGNMLTVKGYRKNVAGGGSDLLHVRNRPEGEFEQSVPMPTPVDADRVSAECREGVLTVRLGKSESAKSHRIPVQSGQSAPVPG